jgi:uncharacterized protein
MTIVYENGQKKVLVGLESSLISAYNISITCICTIKGGTNMPRRKRLRRICFLPEHTLFGPIDRTIEEHDSIRLSIDAYESIRLIDLLGYDQKEAALALDVSRGTLQRIYYEAKRKVAEALVYGKHLSISGDRDVRMCDHPEHVKARKT